MVRYSDETWQTIRLAYESGQFSSYAKVRSHLATIFPKLPSLVMIKKKGREEGWGIDPLEVSPKFKEVVNASIEAQFEAVGITREKVLKKLGEVLNMDIKQHPWTVMMAVDRYIRLCGLEKMTVDVNLNTAQDEANNAAYERRRSQMKLAKEEKAA